MKATIESTNGVDTAADVPIATRRALLQQEIQLWKNTRFQAESRRRTYARIGNAEQTQAQIKLLEECEGALMDLAEQLAELS